MIRYEFHLDPDLKEMVVQCHAAEQNNDCLAIERYISELNMTSTKIVGVGEDGNREAKLIDLDEVYRFYTERKRVFAELADSIWQVKFSLSKLEELCATKDFIRINQGEIVNLKHVDRLDLSLTGVIGLKLKNYTQCYVSRRSLKAFKEKLGI